MSSSSPNLNQNTDSERLVSWKAIAAYFERDERTVRRWEQERGLPVHRFPGGEKGRVFAYASELDEWLHSGAVNEESVPSEGAMNPLDEAAHLQIQTDQQRESVHSSSVSHARRLNRLLAATLIFLILALIGVIAWRSSRSFTAANNKAHIPSHAAQELYWKGHAAWERRTDESLKEAVDDFTQAIVKDSNYAEAYAGLAECYDLLPEYSTMPTSQAMPRAISAAEKALSLNDSLPQAHRALGFALFWWQWDFRRGMDEYQKAIQLDPNDVEAHHWYATALMLMRQFDEAGKEFDKAHQLDPSSRAIIADRDLMLYVSGHQKEAMTSLRELDESQPDFSSPPRYLARMYFEQRDYPNYLRELDHEARISRNAGFVAAIEMVKKGWSKGGEKGLDEALYQNQAELLLSGEFTSYDFAAVAAKLGKQEEMMHYLAASMDEHDYLILGILGKGWDSYANNYAPLEALRETVRKRFDLKSSANGRSGTRSGNASADSSNHS